MHLPLLSLPESDFLVFFPIYWIISSSVNNNPPTFVGRCSLSELTVPKGLGILSHRLTGWRIHGIFPSFSWVSWWKVALNGPASAMPTGQAQHRSLGICSGWMAGVPWEVCAQMRWEVTAGAAGGGSWEYAGSLGWEVRTGKTLKCMSVRAGGRPQRLFNQKKILKAWLIWNLI